MTEFFAPRKAPSFPTALCTASLLALLASGCGGGDADLSSNASAAAAAGTDTKEVAEASGDESVQAVSTAEVVVNNLFASGLDNWNVGDAVLVNSSQRVGGKSLNVGWRALQTFAHGTLTPRASYTLKVRAKNEKTTGTATVAVKFQIPPYAEAFRTFALTVSGNTWQDYEIQFTAPVYTQAELSVLANGTRTVIDSVSIKQRATIAQTEPIAAPSGSFVPAGYTLAFNDEFNGTQLNRSKWFTRMVYNNGTLDRMHDEKQRYRDNNNHQVSNGVLSLIARKVSTTDPSGINYESGMIRSDWTSRYGYYEARVKMPGGKGVWPAFWLNSDVSEGGRLAWPPEIDIFEFVNNGVEDLPNMIHSNVKTHNNQLSPLIYADPSFNPQWTFWQAPYNFNDGWHVVGAEWTPTEVTMYVDGQKIYTRSYSWTYADGTLAGPAHILLNLGIGGAWAGRNGIDDTAFPQALQIDWVRAYTKVN